MRVTRLIKDYVIKRVGENYPKTAEEIAWEEKSKKMNEAITEANTMVETYAKQIAAELNKKYGFLDGYFLEAFEGRNFVTSRGRWEDKQYLAFEEAARKRKNTMEKTIEEILVNLELGGTKAELEKMLAEIGK